MLPNLYTRAESPMTTSFRPGSDNGGGFGIGLGVGIGLGIVIGSLVALRKPR